MKTNPTDKAIAALKARQQAIALHYIQITLDRDKLEAEAIANLKQNPEGN